MVMITFSGCDAKEKQEQKTLSLSEYLEESNENWFLTGKKEYTIQAMMVSNELQCDERSKANPDLPKTKVLKV